MTTTGVRALSSEPIERSQQLESACDVVDERTTRVAVSGMQNGRAQASRGGRPGQSLATEPEPIQKLRPIALIRVRCHISQKQSHCSLIQGVEEQGL